MHSVPFFTTAPTAVPTTVPTRPLHGPYSPYKSLRFANLSANITFCNTIEGVTHAHTTKHQCNTILPESVPSEKNVPSMVAVLHPHTPNRCNVGCQQSRIGDRFPGAKKSFPSCLRVAFRSRQRCKGGAGWPQPRNELGECRGDVFFARDGKGSHHDRAGIGIRANYTCALEAWPRLRLCKFGPSKPPPR